MTDVHSVSVDRIDVSIILVCWNSLALTSAAIRTVREHTAGVQFEIIVIDNESVEDDCAKKLADRFPDVRLILNRENLGFAVANNQGLAVARGRHVLFLNSDTVQTENAIGRAVEYLDAHPGVGILGVMHRNGDRDRTFQQSAAKFPTPMASCRRVIVGTVKKTAALASNEPPPEGDVDWVTGSFLLARRACLDEVGSLDERFFVYAEDIDLCYQTRKFGWRVRFWPGVSLVHFGSSSARTNRGQNVHDLPERAGVFSQELRPTSDVCILRGDDHTPLALDPLPDRSGLRPPSAMGRGVGSVEPTLELHDSAAGPTRPGSFMMGVHLRGTLSRHSYDIGRSRCSRTQ